MAFDPKTNSTNSDNCSEHRWPRVRPGGSFRSIGSVEHEQCNNCLATRITFKTTKFIDGEWNDFMSIRIIEPNFEGY